ncbi:MAG: hypothetical protein KF678_15705, partial [Phycisphaeraceae bacterium]|nr:hypothetical protein [Phycisphaeraceae bacterium]
TYDAYGEALTSTTLHPHPVLRCGHKGLFVDRLDLGVMSSSLIEHERIVPFSHTLCYNRNRTYSPQAGRFLQRDPNETGMALLAATGYGGRGAAALSIAFGLEGHYGDGLNVYEYLGSNPWNRSDPMGLSWDPFSMVDEYLAEDAGSKAAFLERISGGMQAAAFVGSLILSQLPFPVAMVAGELGAAALEGGVSPELRALKKVLGEVNLARLMISVGKVAIHAAVSAIKYVVSHGLRAIWNVARRLNPLSLAKQAWNALRGCGCFTHGTLVWTLRGLIPIEEVVEGDMVVSWDDVTDSFSLRRVVETFMRSGAPIVAIALRDDCDRQQFIDTTEEHLFWVHNKRWIAAGCLRPGDQIGAVGDFLTVEAVRFESRTAGVYNFEVDGLRNYRIGPNGIIVHNGISACWLWAKNHLIPMYLGGAKRGTKVVMYERDHVLLHKLIDDAAGHAGVPLMRQGSAAVEAYIRSNGAAGIAKIKQVLIDGYSAYDAKRGTTLLQDLLREFKKQGW